MADSETQQQMTSKTPDTKSHQAADLLLEGVSNALALLGVIGIEDAPNFKKALETKCKTDIMNYMPPGLTSVAGSAAPLVRCTAKYAIETHGDWVNKMFLVIGKNARELIQQQ